MVKVSTAEGRNLKRSRRLQKKLFVGEFKVETHLIFGKFKPLSGSTQDEKDDEYFERMDEITDRIIAIGGYPSMSELCGDDAIIHVDVSTKTSNEDVIKLAKETEWLTDKVVTDRKDAFYDPVWDEDEFTDLKHWPVIAKID
ncbi:TPA: hypothetical protein ACPVZG_000180 [Vibrio parahaemolyticus]